MKKLFSSEWPGIAVCALGVVVALLGMPDTTGNQVDLGVGLISLGTALLFLASLHTQKQQLAQQHEELELQRKELAHQSTEFARQNKLAVWQTMVEYFVVLLENNNKCYNKYGTVVESIEIIKRALLSEKRLQDKDSDLINREFWLHTSQFAKKIGEPYKLVRTDISKEKLISDENIENNYIEGNIKVDLILPNFNIKRYGIKNNGKADGLKTISIYESNLELLTSSIALVNHLKNMHEFHGKEFEKSSTLWQLLGVRYLFSTEWMVLNLYHLLFFRGEVQLAQFLAQHIIIDRPLRIWALQQAANLLRQGRTDLFENL